MTLIPFGLPVQYPSFPFTNQDIECSLYFSKQESLNQDTMQVEGFYYPGHVHFSNVRVAWNKHFMLHFTVLAVLCLQMGSVSFKEANFFFLD